MNSITKYLLITSLALGSTFAVAGCNSDSSSANDNTDEGPYTKQLLINKDSVSLRSGESQEVGSKLSCGCGFNLHTIKAGDTTKCKATFSVDFSSDHSITVTAANNLASGTYNSTIILGAQDKIKSHIAPDTLHVTVVVP